MDGRCLAMATQLGLDSVDQHPLAQELDTLRAAVARYQDEAHATALKLQRHSLETAHALHRTHAQEREVVRLREEIEVLREHPAPTPHPASLQVTELTLALRHLSDKLTLTENVLLTRNEELAHAQSLLAQREFQAEQIRDSAIIDRRAEDDARIREFEMRARAAEEERRLTDLVVQEYADLVRSLEGRTSGSASASTGDTRELYHDDAGESLVQSLAEGRAGLKRLFEEFSAETESLEAVIVRLRHELAQLTVAREAEQKAADQERAALAEARLQLDQLQVDDSSAAKMVSRYMKFSQSSTNTLQSSLTALQTRHAASLATLSHQVSSLSSSLSLEQRESTRLRDAVDSLGNEIAREAAGRRREVSLRLAMMGREEALGEALRRWKGRAGEALSRIHGDHGDDVTMPSRSTSEAIMAMERMISDADALTAAMDDAFAEYVQHPDGLTNTGPVERILLARNAALALGAELAAETTCRMDLERRLALMQVERPDTPPPSVPPKSISVDASVHPGDNGIAQSPVLENDAAVDPTIDISIPHPTENIDGRSPSEDSHYEHEVSKDTAPLEQNAGDAANAFVTDPGLDQQMMHSPPPQHNGSPSVSPSDLVRQEAEHVVSSEPAVMSNGDGPNTSVDHLLEPQASESYFEAPEHEQPATHALPTQQESTAVNSPPLEAALPHPLLLELQQVKGRYDTLQRAFRDCHLALKSLKRELATSSPSADPNALMILESAAARLDDYTEDVRVELEIRAADDHRLAFGYETLLSVPGALALPGTPGQHGEEPLDVENDVRAFVAGGVDGAAMRAIQLFEKKLDDVQHDIAALKRAVHPPSEVSSPLEEEPEVPANGKATWPSWTGGLFGSPSRSASPAPTFGAVMTSPRLRRIGSAAQLRANGADPYAQLGLRVPMPAHAPHPQPQHWPVPARPRTMSGMYGLGLGSKSALGLANLRALKQGSPPPGSEKEWSGETGWDMEDDGDEVE